MSDITDEKVGAKVAESKGVLTSEQARRVLEEKDRLAAEEEDASKKKKKPKEEAPAK